MTTIQLKRAEHLLWIVPLFYGIVTNITAHVDGVFMYYNGLYFTLGFFLVTFFFLAILTIPFLLHLYLRKLGERQFILSWLHVVISIFMIMAVLFIFSINLPINPNWRYHIGELSQYSKWLYYNDMAIIITQLFIGVQVLFSVYSITNIIQYYLAQNKKNQYNEEYNLEYNTVPNTDDQLMTA